MAHLCGFLHPGVPVGCGDKELRTLFSTYGDVQDVYILASKSSQEGQRVKRGVGAPRAEACPSTGLADAARWACGGWPPPSPAAASLRRRFLHRQKEGQPGAK